MKKSCDNCGNGPFLSDRCTKKTCNGNPTSKNSTHGFANWIPRRKPKPERKYLYKKWAREIFERFKKGEGIFQLYLKSNFTQQSIESFIRWGSRGELDE